MTARLLSSFLWIGILLVPPVRFLLVQFALFVWPNVEPFTKIGNPSAPQVPLIVSVLIGYALTTYLAQRFLIPRLRAALSDSSRSEEMDLGTPGFPWPLALLVTLAWLGAVIIEGSAQLYHLLVAGLVMAGIAGQKPQPRPSPQPTPRPAPEPVDEDDYPEDSEDDQFYYRAYQWHFNEEPYRKTGKTHLLNLSLRIPKEIYKNYKARPRNIHSNSDYVRFINEELQDDVVSPLTEKIRSLSRSHGFDDLAEIHLAMAFTLSFDYARDIDGDYPNYPVETLVEKKGDCEDHANLCGALFHNLGLESALVLMDTGPKVGHAALAVEAPIAIPGASFTSRRTGRDLFYCEVTPASNSTTKDSTNVQWWLGMAPMEGATGFTLWEIEPAAS